LTDSVEWVQDKGGTLLEVHENDDEIQIFDLWVSEKEKGMEDTHENGVECI